jgi:hypothetical protein
MSMLKYFSVILVGLAATVCQAEIGVAELPPTSPLVKPAAPSATTPSEVELKVEPLRLAIDLVDGSHIIGVPSITSVPIQTSYARMDIPLEKIANIEIGDDHETAAIDLQNGDKLKGVLDLKPLELETIFGTVSVGIEHISSMEICPGANTALPAKFQQGLVLHYSFEERRERIEDKSGKGNHGVVHGAKWTPKGKTGGAYAFDGDGDFIDAGNALSSPINGTVAVWFKTSSTRRQFIIGQDGLGWNNLDTILSISQGNVIRVPEGYLSFETHGPRQSLSRGANSGRRVSDDSWHFAAATANGREYVLYLDGARVGQVRTDLGMFGGRTTIKVGGEPVHGDDKYFIGSIDEVMIWNHALSALAIQKLYNAQK